MKKWLWLGIFFFLSFSPALASDDGWQRYQIGRRLVFFQPRKIGEAIVEKDFLNYQFDRQTGELLKTIRRWRPGLTDQLPELKISQVEAETQAEGEVLFSKLYLLAPDSDVFPLEPAPKNPCWIVRSQRGEEILVTIIDAVTGGKLGYGVPPPTGEVNSSLTGPCDCSYGCQITWSTWYQNAAQWFALMGYESAAAACPAKAAIQRQLKNPQTRLFYEIAHGDSQSFRNNCQERIYAADIQNWLADRSQINFSFLGSCGAMCQAGPGTLAYELRKGLDKNAVSLGYCGMMEAKCEPCMVYSFLWQNAFSQYLFQGEAVKEAFEKALADYPMCLSANCLRFSGDEDYHLPLLVSPLKVLLAHYNVSDDKLDFNADWWINSLDFTSFF